MSSRFRKLVGAGAAAALIVGLAACSTSGEGGGNAGGDSSGEPVRFGVALPDTGNSAQYGEYFRQGFDLALQEINAAVGVQGRQV